ncbi:MAG: SCO family protein [Asticcacaulis sp.]
MTKIRLTIILAAFGLLVAVAGLSWFQSLRGPQAVSQIDPSVHIGGPFALVDTDGRPVTEAALKGKWTAVFFGYTYCPDICPLTLQNMAATQRKLGDKAKNFQILFITVDPARDTPKALKSYLAKRRHAEGRDWPQRNAKADRCRREGLSRGTGALPRRASVIYLMDRRASSRAPDRRHVARPERRPDQTGDARRLTPFRLFQTAPKRCARTGRRR